MPGPVRLHGLPRAHDTLVCVDSDGTVFDTMLPKQRICFQGAFLSVLGLQPAEALVRETLEFTGLFSRTRGINRFAIFLHTLEHLVRRPEFLATGLRLPDTTALRAWVDGPGPLSAGRLEADLAARPDPAMRLALEWSRAVTDCVERHVQHVSPFPGARETLLEMAATSDLVIVSATQQSALDRDWSDNEMTGIPLAIAGAEAGTKEDQITAARANRYPPERVLMIGDSPGDLKAARVTGVRFFPMIPGDESASWLRLRQEIHPSFLRDAYTADQERAELEHFLAALPETPPWVAQGGPRVGFA